MQKLSELPSKAWVSLLWSQYNVLSKPLKDGLSGLANQIADEINGQNLDKEAQGFLENEVDNGPRQTKNDK